MNKLQYVFMTLAVLCFALPAFADGGSAVVNLVPIGAGIQLLLVLGLAFIESLTLFTLVVIFAKVK